MLKFPGKRPETLGVRDGRLAPCPAGGACVSSQLEAETRGEPAPHHVPPYRYSGRVGDAMTRLLAVLLERPRCTVVSQTQSYLHAEIESSLFGLITDLEFLAVAGDETIHLRAAPRAPFADFGRTRALVEELRIAFDEAS